MVSSSRKYKRTFLESYSKEEKIKFENIIYLGNDINDLEVMEKVGCSIAPRDANPLIRDISTITLTKNGGEGAIREFCELVLDRF